MSISKYLKGFLAESACEREEEIDEKKELTGGQKELDVDGDGDIEADDLKDLRNKKKKIEEEIAKYDQKTKTTKSDDTDLEDATDGDEPKGQSSDVKKDKSGKVNEEDDEEEDDEEEIDEGIATFDDENNTTVVKKGNLEEEEDEDEDEDELDEEISVYDQKTKTTKNRKGSLEEATIVLPSDTSLVSLKALSKKANTMLVPKVKAELEKKGLVKGGKITQTGKDLLGTPDAEDKIKEIGS